ncbi:hypothetical protein VC83_02810 [Pseudogymnoascus destructans]|uniref:Uncharacterized protein n=2 Tax=Pseudogymnoascus destructans TaxID=655981 RepID=L8FVL1_PSED2|nr:uncharacterized protein VC83_02810 [Pseudogymnoascus destructans]ELR04922.1 hypothetical protein GMDG_00180 [Pseudogymnoascus destructans 20631-21]OAF60084.1 hypothetical protein VC83_02810 [Pseudogymnoascus destructans]
MGSTRPSPSGQRTHLLQFPALPRTNNETVSKIQGSKQWVPLVAGGAGGVTSAILTAPLDVLRTRLQSEFYRRPAFSGGSGLPARSLSPTRHTHETLRLLRDIHRLEGPRALFKGAIPLIAGLGPSSALKFWTYNSAKRGLERRGVQGGWLHAISAAVAGGVVCTVMCPVWVVKTRVQLDPGRGGRYKGAIDCVGKIWGGEGWRGLWGGLGASYLGVGEGVVMWVVYERVKRAMTEREERRGGAGEGGGREKGVWERVRDGAMWAVAAGGSKGIAVGVAYPHEVLRTRLRQAPVEGVLKYTGVVQCARLVVREEGMGALYGGLTPHLMRAVPASAIMFGVFEVVMRVLGGEGE